MAAEQDRSSLKVRSSKEGKPLKTEDTDARILPYLKEHKRKNRIRRILGMLSAGTAACVFAVMMLPGISMGKADVLLSCEKAEVKPGETVGVEISAEAGPETVFLISPENGQALLSDEYSFSDGKTDIQEQSGDTLSLHKNDESGGAGYWFRLDSGKSAKFTLNFILAGDGISEGSDILRAVQGDTLEAAKDRLGDELSGSALKLMWSNDASASSDAEDKAVGTKQTASRAILRMSANAAEKDAASFSALSSAVSAGGTQTLKLTNDITADAQLVILSGSNITIDLNGHSMTNAYTGGTLFNISGGELTITDSAAASETVETVNSGNMYGNVGLAAASGTLTYYVTETSVTNAATGATAEVLKKHTVTASGLIKNGSYGSVFSVSGGTLNMQGGMLCGGSYPAVEQSGGTVNISGGYICGVENAYTQNGGAAAVTGGNLNISGKAVIAGNSASNYGGAVYALHGTKVTISDNAVISGNAAGSDGGGVWTGGELTISGGYITNNSSKGGGVYGGGGGVFLAGDAARLSMSAGYVTGNYSRTTGGGIGMQEHDAGSGVTLSASITGGFISGNVADVHEGGGLTVRGYDTCTMTGGYITNNKTLTSQNNGDWGGGGVFISENGTLNITDVLITDNSSESYGAGVSACSTGKVYLYVQDGAAVYGNAAGNVQVQNDAKNEGYEYTNGNTVFTENGYQDVFCVHQSMVTGAMLGGNSAGWSGSSASCSGTATAAAVIAATKAVSGGLYDVITANDLLGLTANPTADAKTAAQKAAHVYINGNSSTTHGGGIMSNGNLVLGTPDNVMKPVGLALNGAKTLKDNTGAELAQDGVSFDFIVTDENGKQIATGKSKNGAVAFDTITFDTAGTYTYYVAEQADASMPAVTFDTARYRLTVTVVKDASGTALYGDTKLYDMNISCVTVERSTDSGATWTSVKTLGAQTASNSTVTLPASGSGIVFSNVKVPTTAVSVEKKWASGTTPSDSVQIQLSANGEACGSPVTLNAANNWLYCWKELPKYSSDGTNAIAYTVSELPISGFKATVEQGTPPVTSNTSVSYSWASASAFENGATYMLIGTGQGALSNTGGSSLSWAADTHADAANTPEYSEWTAEASGSGFRLTNKGTGRVLASLSSMSYAAGTAASAGDSDVIEAVYTLSAGKLATASRYSMSSNFGFCYGSEDSAQSFTLYKLTTSESTTTTPISDLHYVVTNTASEGYVLPDTGGTGSQGFVCGGLALMAGSLAAAAALRRRRGRRIE
jgi:pilin isopeptide linkage protein